MEVNPEPSIKIFKYVIILFIMICTYKIINKNTSKYYYGSSKCFSNRKRRHLYDLRNNKHHSINLQRAFNKYGEESFEFRIERKFDTQEDAKKYEQNFLNNANFNCLYNVSKYASGGDLISKHPNRENIINKIKASLERRYNSLTAQERQKIYGNCGVQMGCMGKLIQMK